MNQPAKPRRGRRRALSTVGIAAALIAGGTSTAQAYTGGTTSCFSWHIVQGITTQTVYATNTCGTTQSFQVGQNSPWGTYWTPCTAVAAHQTGGWSWTKVRKFKGFNQC